MLNDCTHFLTRLDLLTPDKIRHYEKFKIEVQKQIETNIYRDPSSWKYSLMEISYLVRKYLKNHDQDEEIKKLCEDFKQLIERV